MVEFTNGTEAKPETKQVSDRTRRVQVYLTAMCTLQILLCCHLSLDTEGTRKQESGLIIHYLTKVHCGLATARNERTCKNQLDESTVERRDIILLSLQYLYGAPRMCSWRHRITS